MDLLTQNLTGRLFLKKLDYVYSVNDVITGDSLYQTMSKQNAVWKMQKIHQDDREQSLYNKKHKPILRNM